MRKTIASDGRWVLLKHTVSEAFEQAQGRANHFDLLVEPSDQAKLWTWAMDRNIFIVASNSGTGALVTCDATRLPDHRRRYLEFEGKISGNRGHVQRLVDGQFSVVETVDGLALMIQSKSTSRISVCGRLEFIHIAHDSWQIEFSPSS